MKTWTNPMAVAQQFAANDYVSSCTFTLTCDVPLNGFTQYTIFMDQPYPVCEKLATNEDGSTIYLTQTTYKPCGAPHYGMSTNGKFFPVTFTEGLKDGKIQQLPEPISCYGWVEYCDCDDHDVPHIINGHNSMSDVMYDANKS